MRRQFSERERAEFVAEWKATGCSMTAIAKRWGIARKTAAAWIRESGGASEAGQQMPSIRFAQWVPVSSAEAPLVVQIGAARIEVSSGTDLNLLSRVAGVLSEGLTS